MDEVNDEYFARKYRQACINDIVGNTLVLNVIKSYLKQRKMPQNIIFYGINGVCKTVLMTLIVKALNCEHPTVDGDACCECPTCKKLDEVLVKNRSNEDGLPYKFFDMGAYGNDDEYVKQIINTIETVNLFHDPDKYFCLLLEEFQDIKISNQRTLFKTFENLPKNVIVISALNDLWKMDNGLVNRGVETFELQPPSEAELLPFTLRICRAEHIKLNENLRRTLIRVKNNNPRLILNALQVIQQTGVAGMQYELRSQSVLADYIKFVEYTKMGLAPVIQYITNISNKIDFCKGFTNFVNLIIELRFTGKINSLPKEVVTGISNVITGITDNAFATISASLLDTYINTEDRAVAMLYRIALYLNKDLYTQINMSDEHKTAHEREVNTDINANYTVGAGQQEQTDEDLWKHGKETGRKVEKHTYLDAKEFARNNQISEIDLEDL